jgi:tripeptidyl-peptidase-1
MVTAQRQLLCLLLLAGTATATTTSSGGSFELELGLKQRGLAGLQQRFWSIADPASTEYLQHLSRRELTDLIGAEPLDIAAARGWLRALGATGISVGPLQDSVTGTFASEAAARASGHWQHWSMNAAGRWLPALNNHTRPLDYVLRRDGSVATGAKPTTNTVMRRPAVAAEGGLATHNMQYDIAAQKHAYKMPVNLTATNPRTTQMVWGPGTFGYGKGGLEGFRDAHCPLLNVDKVKTDGFKGKAGGDNYGEGNLDTRQVASFGLNVSTLVSNTNTSASTEEGMGFGQAMLDFVTSLAARPVVPHVLSLSLGSLSPHSCNILCDEAVKLGQSMSACRAYLQQQRQVCMFISEAQVARIDTALQMLGVRGVSIFGSSGDGGSHWSFGEFDPEDPMGTVLNKIGCQFQFPIYPSPSPYMISVGGTMWADQDPTKPVFWNTHSGTGGAGGGGFAWQWPMPAHQKATVVRYLRSQGDAGTLPPQMSFNQHGRAYPDISAVAVQGTSESSPTVAGIFSMITDHRLNLGPPPLGFRGPRLWAAMEQHPGVAFEDVTVGNTNTSCGNGFHAATGWDPATGWGRPIWPGMLQLFGSSK